MNVKVQDNEARALRAALDAIETRSAAAARVIPPESLPPPVRSALAKVINGSPLSMVFENPARRAINARLAELAALITDPEMRARFVSRGNAR